MKKLPTPKIQVIQETTTIAASLGFVALACTLLLAQGFARLIMKNF